MAGGDPLEYIHHFVGYAAIYGFVTGSAWLFNQDQLSGSLGKELFSLGGLTFFFPGSTNIGI